MIRWMIVFVCWLPLVAWAEPDGELVDGDAEVTEEVVEDIAANKKKRAGSYILGNRGLFKKPDLRGDFERRRDQELLKHFTRTAQLDAIRMAAVVPHREHEHLVVGHERQTPRRPELPAAVENLDCPCGESCQLL